MKEYAPFLEGFIRLCDDGWLQGWHERNGGNLSYRMTEEDHAAIAPELKQDAPWQAIGAAVPALGGSFFAVTGSGKYFRNVRPCPEESVCIIELDAAGENYRILWGLTAGGRPTSELPTHLLNHEVKVKAGQDVRVIYHAHPANLIAMTFVLPLEDAAFTRELWEMATECPVVFPDGVGVVPWMVPGGRAIGLETAKKMEDYDAVVWAHHGLFCAGPDFDTTFGLMHTVEKSAEIFVKVRSMVPEKRQTITSDDFRALAKDFNVILPEKFLK